MIPSTPKLESVREHYPLLTSKARLRALLRQNENITNKDVLQLRRILRLIMTLYFFIYNILLHKFLNGFS
jgi:hypothetical protein